MEDIAAKIGQVSTQINEMFSSIEEMRSMREPFEAAIHAISDFCGVLETHQLGLRDPTASLTSWGHLYSSGSQMQTPQLSSEPGQDRGCV